MKVDSGYADVNGTRLYYEVAGVGHPLVLIHGFGGNLRMWDDQFTQFASHYKVIRYDARGFGKSAMPVEGESYRHEEDLRALLEYLDICKASLIGQSMGGGIGIDFAINYPESTHSLVLVDSNLDGHRRSKDYNDLMTEISSKWREEGPEAALEILLSNALLEAASENSTVITRFKQIISSYSGWHLVNTDPQRALTIPAIRQLDKIAIPTLIIIGERDMPHFHNIAKILEQGIHNSNRVTLEGVGHISNMEDPESFNRSALVPPIPIGLGCQKHYRLKCSIDN